MILSFTAFAALMVFGIIGLVGLATFIYTDSMNFASEIKFFLDQRIIKHNRDKAKLAIVRSKYSQLEKENQQLQTMLEKYKQGVTFEAALKETDFVESDKKLDKTGFALNPMS